MHSRDEFGAAAGDSPESDEDEDGGWLAHSQFGLERDPPDSLRERRPLSEAEGFDVSIAFRLSGLSCLRVPVWRDSEPSHIRIRSRLARSRLRPVRARSQIRLRRKRTRCVRGAAVARETVSRR
jgi:hypothetical protein